MAMLFDKEWNFYGNTPAALDNVHPYPTKFIREIPSKLLAGLSPNKELFVYDPFCGSGTTLAIAQEAGYKALGVDLNPIACLISRVKVNQYDNNFDVKKC
jgi:site-specific DNA-methyltransferase (cytosine-N4-specific)